MKEIKTIMDLSELPDPLKLVKLDLYDKVFTQVQSNYYFSLLFGIDYNVAQKAKEELFNKGALIKITSERDKKPTFYPTPPTFISLDDKISPKMKKRYKVEIEHLEKVYYEMFCNIKDSFLKQKLFYYKTKGKFFQGLVLFLMKKFAVKNIDMVLKDMDYKSYEQIRFAVGDELMKKIRLIIPYNKDLKEMKGFGKIKKIPEEILLKERIIKIDDAILLDFSSLINTKEERVVLGYLSKNKEFISEAKKKIEFLLKLDKG